MLEYFSHSFSSVYEVIWVFFLYAFIGWCTEVAYAALDTGKFVNRGFLNGPVCPIYGFGLVIVLGILTPLKDNMLILFAGSFILTSALEFFVGWLLEKCFHNKWWDYSDQHFNICGYVCLKFSILWGLACLFVVDVFHPVIMKIVMWIPKTIGVVLLVLFALLIITDTVITVVGINAFNKRMRLLEKVQENLKAVSNEIGEEIFENVIGVKEKSEELKDTFEEKHGDVTDDLREAKEAFRESIEDRKEDFRESIDGRKEEFMESLNNKKEELQKKYQELLEQRSFVANRLIKAFPEMQSKDHKEILERIKEKSGIVKKEVKENKK